MKLSECTIFVTIVKEADGPLGKEKRVSFVQTTMEEYLKNKKPINNVNK